MNDFSNTPQAIDTDNIRSDSDLYQKLIIRHLDRIAMLLANAVSKTPKEQEIAVVAVELAIRLHESFLAPYRNKKYDALREKLTNKINVLRASLWDDNIRQDYLERIIEWLDEQIKQFGKAGILPTMEEELEMPKPTVDVEELPKVNVKILGKEQDKTKWVEA